MAKKTVATLQEGKKDGRSYSKVIRMVKSPKTGAYIFDDRRVKIRHRFSLSCYIHIYLPLASRQHKNGERKIYYRSFSLRSLITLLSLLQT